MDEFSLQETDRFQCQQVVHQEGVRVFQSTDDTPEDEADTCIYSTCWGSTQRRMIKDICVPMSINACLWSVVFCVTPQQLHHHLCCSFTVSYNNAVKSLSYKHYHSRISLCITNLFNHLFWKWRLPFLAVHQCFIYQPQKCVFFLCG